MRTLLHRWRARTAGALATALVAGAAVVAGPVLPAAPAAAVPPPFNYGEALQKAIWFYEAQHSGEKPDWNRVSWRGDSFLDDVFGGVDLTGGFHDAGDHIKATFPMAHSMAVLAWGMLEWPEAYTDTGQRQHLLNNLRWGMDWLIRGHPSPDRFVALVGDPSTDHRKWAAAEVQTYQREAWFIDPSCPGADLAGSGAAAFAAASLVFRDSDPGYASTLLTHARQLYAFADQAPMSPYNAAFEYERCAPVGGIYESHSGYRDELVWGAIWLSRATTGTESAEYLAKAEEYYDLLPRSGQGSPFPPYQWTLDWDDKAIASEVLLAKLTGDPEYVTDVSRWADYTTDRVNGFNGQMATYSPGGQIFYLQWGSLRYAMGAAFLAFVAADSGRLDATRTQRLIDFAKRQVNYTLGDNPANLSYLVGFSKNGGPSVHEPHHRTAHGSWTDNLNDPVESRHTLYGALIGGPKSANDVYGAEDRSDFVKAEVALDFNAPYVGNLARMWLDHGGSPLADFPPIETPDGPETYLEAGINQQGSQPGPFLEVKAFIRNKSAWPARHLDDASFRYYFTIDPGVQPSQVQLTTAFNQCADPTGPTQFSGNVYYVAVSCAGQQISPAGQSEWRREVQFRISFPAGSTHDFTADWSYQGIGPDNTTMGLMPRMTLFEGTELIWGDPPGPVEETVPPGPPGTPTVSGLTPGGATVSWTAAQPGDNPVGGYEVRVDGALFPCPEPPSALSCQITGLTPGTQHTVSIRAVDTTGVPGPSVTIVVTTPAADPPTAPGDPVVSDVTATSATLTWGPSTPGTFPLAGYQVYRVVGSTETPLASTSGAATTVTLTGLTPETAYTVRVRARDTAEVLSPPSAPVSFTTLDDGGTGDADCDVAYGVGDWGNGSGFTGSVTITNPGTATIDGWTLEFTFPTAAQRIVNGWNATWVQPAGAAAVSATDLGWNGTIPPGASVTIGFNGSYSGSNPEPTAFTLNGQSCTVS
jgi:endoglucanase